MARPLPSPRHRSGNGSGGIGGGMGTGRFPSPVTTRPDAWAPPRRSMSGTQPSGGHPAARDAATHWPKIAGRGPPRTVSAHRGECVTAHPDACGPDRRRAAATDSGTDRIRKEVRLEKVR
ncbi:hypothetical protein GCM10018966_035670 [Streptomyces yanii]